MTTSTNKYFCLEDDMRISGRWHVKSPVDDKGSEIIPWQVMEGRPVTLDGPWRLPLMRQGHELDFSLTGLHIAVVSQQFVHLLERLGIQDEVQFIPARVDGHPEPYFILNPLHIIKCVDESKCEEFALWGPEDGDPEVVGHYRFIHGLRIDPTGVGNVQIFRPWGWQIAMIVSERVKLAIEEADLVGPVFIEV